MTGYVWIKDSWIFLVTFLFYFFFLSWHDWENKTAEYFSSLFCFFFFSLYLLYYAQDSCKKWQENKDRLGLISEMSVKIFSSLFCFFFFGVTWSFRISQLKISRHFFVFVSFFGVTGSTRIRQPKISRHYFVFLLFSFLFIYCTTRRIVEKSDKKKKGYLGLISGMTVKTFLVTKLFLFFLSLMWLGLLG